MPASTPALRPTLWPPAYGEFPPDGNPYACYLHPFIAARVPHPEHIVHWITAKGGEFIIVNEILSYGYRDSAQSVVKVSLKTGQRQIINPSPYGWDLSLSSSPSSVEPLIAYASCEFVTDYLRNNDTEIALINWSTLDRVRLTDNESYDFFPMWSPDGEHIAFFSWRRFSSPFDSSDGIDINVVNTRGDLTASGRGALLHPVAWSPNSQEFAFIKDIGIEADAVHRGRTNRGPINRIGVFITGIDAIAPKQIASVTSYSRVSRLASIVFGGPSWSPDGQEIAFGGSDDDGVSVHIVGRDGTNHRVIWEGESSEAISQVEWSPDGEEILFIADAVRVVRPDGGGLRQLELPPDFSAPLRNRFARVRATWSPDSSRLAFYNGVNHIIMMNRDGTNARILEAR